MSAISSIAGGSSTGGANGFSELTSEQFIKIMFAELSSQNPLEPSDSKALLDQLASLRSIQSDLDMGQRLDSLVKQNQFAAAATMVGQVVGGVTLDGIRVIDLVVSVSNTPDGPVLNLYDGSRMPFAWVDEVLGPLVDDPDDPSDPDDPDPPDVPGDDPNYISKDIDPEDGNIGDDGNADTDNLQHHPYRGAAT
ncbi:MAG: flagellar hook capping FlgD N-terminal domain-containing protein [Phycisphaerales bacterium]